ncbi:MAG: aminopeptidase, partial [Spirochaetia bacterium]|nr:aminopeptidase [Spirochaetia bacterium]
MESSVFLDRGTDNRHHKTTMRLNIFQRRPKKPLLAPEHKTVHTHKIETLKAGRLASLALDFTSRLIEQFGPRLSTSENAHKAAGQIEQEYRKFCDYTQSSPVAVDMNIHRLPLKVVPIIYLVILVFLFFGLPYLGFILFSLYCYYVYRVLYLYKPFSYKKQQKKQGVNVHGILDPSEEVKQTIVFTAHHDSAPLYSYNQLDRLTYAKKVLLPIALFVLSGILSFLQVLVEIMARTLLLPNMPSLVLALLHLL